MMMRMNFSWQRDGIPNPFSVENERAGNKMAEWISEEEPLSFVAYAGRCLNN
jgi:hypothetical protein